MSFVYLLYIVCTDSSVLSMHICAVRVGSTIITYFCLFFFSLLTRKKSISLHHYNMNSFRSVTAAVECVLFENEHVDGLSIKQIEAAIRNRFYNVPAKLNIKHAVRFLFDNDIIESHNNQYYMPRGSVELEAAELKIDENDSKVSNSSNEHHINNPNEHKNDVANEQNANNIRTYEAVSADEAVLTAIKELNVDTGVSSRRIQSHISHTFEAVPSNIAVRVRDALKRLLRTGKIAKASKYNYVLTDYAFDCDASDDSNNFHDGNISTINRKYPQKWFFKPDFSDVDDSLPALDIGDPQITCKHCRAKLFILERLTNSSKKNPVFTICCKEGKVKFEPIPEPPELLQQLWDGTHEISDLFATNVRRINSALAMGSVGVNFDNSLAPGAPYYRVYGQIVHKIGSCLKPDCNDKPAFAQIWNYDNDEQAAFRMSYVRSKNKLSRHEDESLRKLFLELQSILGENNPLIKQFVQGVHVADQAPELKLVLKEIVPYGEHQRKYNLPSVNEFATIVPDTTTAPGVTKNRVIVMQYKNNGELKKISDLHPMLDPVCYPLLFPFGTFALQLFE